jgi:hypothetical protein
MNVVLFRRVMFSVLLSLGFLLIAQPVSAAEPGSCILQANAFLDIFADRSRMIQGTIVVVILGCACLWWKR